MKKTVALVLVLVLALSIIGTPALAAGSFDKSIFENSTKFSRFGFGSWSLIGGYAQPFVEGKISVTAMLFDSYVSEGWGPELRISFYDNYYERYDEVTAFKASVDDVIYSFDKLAYNDDEEIHAGYCFGGKVYEAFMKDILECKNVMFLISHTDVYGDSSDAVIEHVHTGDLSDLQDMAKYLIRSNAFGTDTDPAGNDSYYGASIIK